MDATASGPGNGSPQAPFPEIQAAVQIAPPGATILVLPGAYGVPVDFLGKSIRVLSTAGPVVTVLDLGGVIGSGPAVRFTSGEGPESLLCGFTIRGAITVSGPDGSADGGGILCWRSSPTIANNVIEGNAAYQYSPSCPGFQPLAFGGGIACVDASPTIVNNVVDSNQALALSPCDAALAGGGGIACRSNSHPLIVNDRITGNVASGEVGAGVGGGVFLWDSAPVIANTTMAGNQVYSDGGLSASGAGLAVFSGTEPASVSNCIVWGNTPDAIAATSPINVSFSDVEGGYPGLGNLQVDPLFLGNGNYRLHPNSPCLDQGNDLLVPIDLGDLDRDGDLGEITPLDLDRFPRFVAAFGGGAYGLVDMGPYEHR